MIPDNILVQMKINQESLKELFMANLYFGEDDFVENTAPRIPVCLCLDVSGSMSSCIHEVERGVDLFYDSVRNYENARQSCEIAVVTYSEQIKVIEDFSLVDSKQPIHLTTESVTNMGQGILKCLELLETRKNKYKLNGVDYYQPWLVVMSDGYPTEPEENMQEAIRAIASLENEKKLTCFVIGIGDGVDMKFMNTLSKRGAQKLKGYNFSAFFEWLGKSVNKVSDSKIGESVELDNTSLMDWLSI